MNLYTKYIMPKLIHLACSSEVNARQRARVVPEASGTVLEVGIGSGLNLPFYAADRVSKVIGLDPSAEMTRMAELAARDMPFVVELVGLSGEEIPLDSGSVDTVLVTYTLCSIANAEAALRQMARVLKPGGKLLFCEHGEAPDTTVRRWQDLASPLWSILGGGCQLNRNIPALIESGGFHITALESSYIDGWRPVSFNYWGEAELA